jgi:O-antigen/teichoic acid export membrane protein
MGTSKQKSITKNSIYYSVYQVLNVIFPFFTGMYVARILLPDAVGKVAYAQNIAQYFVILAFLGLPTYGMREIAKVRDNDKERSKIYSELLVINFISTFIFSLIYLALILSVKSFRDNLALYLVTGGAIALNALNNSWLYEGLEEFRFISIRNIIFKFICFGLLVLLVRSPDDYIIYASITVIGAAGNYIINMAYAPKFVTFQLKDLNLRRHIKSIMLLVVVNLAVELYSLVDVTMLGAMTTDRNVAYYSYASKINKIFVQMINAFTVVIVPRIAFYYKENKKEEFNQLLSKTLETLFVLGIPLVVGLQFCSPDAITLLYGNAFYPSANVLRILSWVLIISPIGYLLGSRVLLVTDHEKTMVLCVGIGAIVNVIGNAILIPRFVEYGAAIASVISEIVVMVFYVHFGRRFFHISGEGRNVLKIVTSSAAMGIFLLIIDILLPGSATVNIFIRLIVQVIGAIVIYFTLLYIFNEPMTRMYGARLIRKLKR